MTRRLTAFLAGRIVQAFFGGWGFEYLDRTFRLPKGTSERVFRRWEMRRKRRRAG